MPREDRRTYGDAPKQRVKLLVSALLAYTNEDLAGVLHTSLIGKLELQQRSNNWLMVKASTGVLIELAGRYEKRDQYEQTAKEDRTIHQGVHVNDVLFHLKNTLAVLEDHRHKRNEAPHFTLKLWHSYKDWQRNLDEIDHKWPQKAEAYYQSVGNHAAKVEQGLTNQEAQVSADSCQPSRPTIVRERSRSSYIGYGSGICKVNAFRLIPFYLGKNQRNSFTNYLGFNTFQLGELRTVYFSDGFVVCILEDCLECKDVVDFLSQRRQAHLSLLKQESQITRLLVENQEKPSTNPLILSVPNLVCYVMSIHHLDNSAKRITPQSIELMTEPSILGITDDPKDKTGEEKIISDSFTFQDTDKTLSEEIYTVKTRSSSFHVCWANVIIETLNTESSDFENLIKNEIILQKLWYKLFLYSDNLSIPEERTGRITNEKLRQIKQEVFRTKVEYMNFVKLDATGSTHLNLLKEKLIQTSKINQVYKDFTDKYNFLIELKSSI